MEVGNGWENGDARRLWGNGCKIQSADDVLMNGTLENCVVLQVNATPVNLI